MRHQSQESPLACALKGPREARTNNHWALNPFMTVAMIVPTSGKALEIWCDVMFVAT